jgi:hypothetical protein
LSPSTGDGWGKTKTGFSLISQRKIREKLLPIFASPPLLVKERGIKGVRIVKDKRLEMSRGGVVEWGRKLCR